MLPGQPSPAASCHDASYGTRLVQGKYAGSPEPGRLHPGGLGERHLSGHASRSAERCLSLSCRNQPCM